MTSTIALLDATTTPVRRRPSLLDLFVMEVRDEVRMIRREPATLVFSVLMPVAFYTLFVGMFGGQTTSSGLPAGTIMLATFGTYGAVVAATVTPGIGLASIRDNGWLEAVKVSPVPVWITLAAKVAATTPYIAGILGAMTVSSAAMGVLDIGVLDWVLLMVALVVGCQSFALLGLTVGALASPNATTAILNAILMPLAIASGLWFPLETMPAWVGSVAPLLPTYHLAQLAVSPLVGGSWLGHLMALVGFTIVLGLAATWAWRRSST